MRPTPPRWSARYDSCRPGQGQERRSDEQVAEGGRLVAARFQEHHHGPVEQAGSRGNALFYRLGAVLLFSVACSRGTVSMSPDGEARLFFKRARSAT